LDTFASVTVVLKHLCSPLFGDFGGLKMASRVVVLRIDYNMVFFFLPLLIFPSCKITSSRAERDENLFPKVWICLFSFERKRCVSMGVSIAMVCRSEQKYIRLDLYRRRQPLTTAHGRLLHRAA